MLGGCGVSLSLYIFVNKCGGENSSIPDIVLFLVTVACTIAGITIQTLVHKRQKNKATKKEKRNT